MLIDDAKPMQHIEVRHVEGVYEYGERWQRGELKIKVTVQLYGGRCA
ncbi:hypothetical protein MH117_20930 [Paenibacillus sp. ACRRX]|nr:hypothetical protein [Paenibacillus sp. ACRRX]MCG7409876.1 hypothetical protein [Paenibacillus sp. ACRRX]